MNKQEVQQRISLNGNPIPLDEFNWCEKTNTFSSNLNNLVIDFNEIYNCTFKTGSDCTFKTGGGCTFKTGGGCTFKTWWDCTFKTGGGCTFDTGSDCTFDTGSDCTFKTWGGCTFDTGLDCTFKTGSDCTFKTGGGCTFDTGSDCTFDTGSDCTFKTGGGCTFDTGSDCTFKTGGGCTFDTGADCTFDTWSDCTFKTGGGCTFDTGGGCTFDTGSDCVIINRNVFEVITPKAGDIIQICPRGVKGHLVNGLYNGIPHIIADGILSKIISQKGDIFKVINHGETETSYLIKKDDAYSHGKTLKEARDSLIYKLSNRDTSKYKDYTLESVVSHEEAIQMYMCISGSCSSGTRYFVEQMQDKIKSNYTVLELIKLTQGQYGNNDFADFFYTK